MAINVRFQHLPNANNEILKAFNSESAAKALEAYQPLDAKNRKREKLKALQLLKQNSESVTLADINLTEGSLAASLSEANGATLQAMLNLLSAKMIEQNKYTIFEKAKESEEHKDKLIKKVQEKSDEEASDKDDEEPENSEENEEETISEQKQKANKELIQALLNSIKLHLEQVKEDILRTYNKVLDIFSLKRLRAALDESIQSVKKYLFDQPVEFIDDTFIAPVAQIPQKIKDYVEANLDSFKQAGDNTELSFSANEIRDLLKKSTSEALNDSLKNSIKVLKSSDIQSKVHSNKVLKQKAIPVQAKATKRVSSEDLRLVMHQG